MTMKKREKKRSFTILNGTEKTEICAIETAQTRKHLKGRVCIPFFFKKVQICITNMKNGN
jgi:hypothetical protein